MRSCILKICLLPSLFIAWQAGKAQSSGSLSAGNIIAATDSFNSRLPAEKLYLHLDKPYYALGDTIWFKSYLFQASTLTWSPLSGLLYVDLINDSSRQVRRMSFYVTYGVAWGQIPLVGEDLPEGNYTIRAYTRWMENFGESSWFSQQLAIAPATVARWAARQGKHPERNRSGEEGDTGSGRAGLSGNSKAGMTGEAITSKLDLQFMPESGWLVAGIPSRVGFKAVGESGMGIDVEGTIVDREGRTISRFHSLHRGMGIFDLLPEEGNTYSAVLSLRDGATLKYPLPAVRKSGIVLRIGNDLDRDSIRFSILASDDRVNGSRYHLLGLARGVACYGANFQLNKREITGQVAKSAFPTGIAHFTLFNDAGEPVNERITFIDHQDNLHIEWKRTTGSFHVRDSIPLSLQVTDAAGKPVEGSFSLAVTDDAQVRTDTSAMEDILSRLLLTSDLKGYVESPGWYFQPGQDGSAALEALLLTQGWTGYDWRQIMGRAASPAFAPEPVMAVSGRVTGLLNAGIKNARVILLSSGKKSFFKDTITDKDGRFTFSNFPPLDTASFFLQARNSKGKSFGLGLTMDENKAPALPGRTHRPAPWSAQADSILLHYVRSNEQMLRERGPLGGPNVLTPVIVRAQPGIRGSQNMNGPGQADLVVDEVQIAKAGKLNLRQLLLKTVKGFNVIYTREGLEQYKVMQYDTRIVIDGVNISRFGPVRETLEYLDAEDITGIEVMYNLRYSARYESLYMTARQQMGPGKERAYIEITSRSGNALFLKRTPGMATFRPLPVSWPKEFYRPRYPADRVQTETDLRSTIHWQPNILTDHQGQAFTSFYAAGTPSTYTIILQGSDMNGNIGVLRAKLQIKKPEE